MSRRICADLCEALIKLRLEWEAETLKVVMAGSAEDSPEWQTHFGSKEAAAGFGEPVQGRQGLLQDRDRARQVGDRLRRAERPERDHGFTRTTKALSSLR
jgi:hypothetical protein